MILKLLNLLPNIDSKNITQIEIESKLGGIIPSNYCKFLSILELYNEILFKLLASSTSFSYSIDTGAIINNKEKYSELKLITSFIHENNLYCESIGEFIGLERNLFFLNANDFKDVKDVMLKHKILIINHLYDTKYWAIGIGNQNQNKIYFLDTYNEEALLAFESFEQYLDSFVVGTYVE